MTKYRFLLTLLAAVLLAALPTAAQSVQALDQKGMDLMNSGHFAEARQVFQQAMQAAPQNAQTMILTGFADVLTQHDQEAETVWATAGRDGKWGTTADVLNGLLAWRNAGWMIAGNWFSLCRPDQSAYASCQVLWKQMKAGAAVPSLDHWTAWIGWTKTAPGPQTGPTTRQLDQQALDQLRHGNLGAAQQNVQQALQRAPKDGPTLIVAGLLAFSQNQRDQATKDWRAAVPDPHWGNSADILNGLVEWQQHSAMLAGNWFGFCHQNIPAWDECQSLLKQMNAGQPAPPTQQWIALAGWANGIPATPTAAVPANNTATAANTAPGNGAQGASGDAPGIIRLDRSSYPPMALAHVNWSNFPATATIQVWFAPVGSAPKTEIGKGLFLNSPYGKVDMRVPWPDQSYQVRFMILSDSKHVYNGPRFFVQPATTFATPPVGHYGCWFYFWGHGTWRSSISWVAISGPKTYQEPRGSGTYIFERPKATLRMTSGPLAGRVAHIYIDDKGRKDILFTFQDNTDAHGKPTIDNGDTNCYLGQK